jgi:hypothetical protein
MSDQYPTHGVYYIPREWLHCRAGQYVHGCFSEARAIADAKALAAVDQSGVYEAVEYSTDPLRVVFSSDQQENINAVVTGQ